MYFGLEKKKEDLRTSLKFYFLKWYTHVALKKISNIKLQIRLNIKTIKNIFHIHSKLPAVYRDVIKSKMNMIIKKIAGSDTHKKKT